MIVEDTNVEQASDLLYKAMLVMAYPIQQADVKIVLVTMYLLNIDEQCVFSNVMDAEFLNNYIILL